jgi:hypothetical protein
VVTDFQETIDAIIKASDFPLSILVVGVGGADFKEMEVMGLENFLHFYDSSAYFLSEQKFKR